MLRTLNPKPQTPPKKIGFVALVWRGLKFGGKKKALSLGFRMPAGLGFGLLSAAHRAWGVPIVSIVVPFFGLTEFLL